MRILVLGASGFIGKQLLRHIEKENCIPIALSRSGVIEGFSGISYTWYLGQKIHPLALESIDCVLHLAHDMNGESGAKLTLESTLSAILECRRSGVAKQIYFSSYSAGPHATSIYGKTKFSIEQKISMMSDVVIVRPGLVLGDGGIFGRIRTFVERSPVIPLPGGGHGLIPAITIDRLCEETLKLARNREFTKEVNIFEPVLMSLRELVMEEGRRINKIPLILSIPSRLVLIALDIANVLRLPLPINADNLRGFIANQGAKHVSNLKD